MLFPKNTSPFVNLFNLTFKLELSSFSIGLDFSKIIFKFSFFSSTYLLVQQLNNKKKKNKYKKNLFTEI